MTLEEKISAIGMPIFNNRMWWGSTPDNLDVSLPFLVVQQVGGERYRYVENDNRPSMIHGRFQFRVWAKRRIDASALMLQLENALNASNVLATEMYGGPIGDYEDVFDLHGSRQDFGFWTQIDP